jgi:hypothetical protein
MSDIKALNTDIVQEQWSKTYSKEGKPDWSHIFPYYSDDILFHDSIQVIKGKEDFVAMCNRLTKRCRSLYMEIYNVSQTENVIFLEWKMTMSFRIFPSSPMYGTSRLTLNEDGLIMEQRDYYDLWGDIADNVPIYRKLYRFFMRVFFG